jgi:hypothetical protein
MSQRSSRSFASTLALTTALASAAATVSGSAFAQNPNCPPGGWFCADAQTGAAIAPGAVAPTPAAPAAGPSAGASASGSGKLEPLPPPSAGAGAGVAATAGGNASTNAGNNVVIVQAPTAAAPQPAPAAGQPPVAAQQAAAAPAPPVYVYQQMHDLPRKEWGLNLHLQGALMGRRSNSVREAGMGGLGVGLRYRFAPSTAVEGNLDFYGGRDYNGDQRSETALTINGLAFLNPKSKLQFYMIGGIGWSAATVRYDVPASANYYAVDKATFGYFGGHLGLGAEWRLGRGLAVNADLRGFIRSRLGNNPTPEFVSSNGRATNTSGGGLFNVGATLYF